MPLPIGGLMSDLDYETVAKEQNEIVEGAKRFVKMEVALYLWYLPLCHF